MALQRALQVDPHSMQRPPSKDKVCAPRSRRQPTNGAACCSRRRPRDRVAGCRHRCEHRSAARRCRPTCRRSPPSGQQRAAGCSNQAVAHRNRCAGTTGRSGMMSCLTQQGPPESLAPTMLLPHCSHCPGVAAASVPDATSLTPRPSTRPCSKHGQPLPTAPIALPGVLSHPAQASHWLT